MTPQQKPEFILTLCAIGEMFKRDITETIIEIYWKIFERFEMESFKQAASRVMMKERFFPVPAVILDEIVGTDEDNALKAWEQIKYALRAHGAYESVIFEDGKIGAIIESFGGWPQFCMLKETEIDSFKRAEFIKLYKALSQRDPKLLPGIFEIQNAVKFSGYKREPVIISTQKKRMLLTENNKNTEVENVNQTKKEAV